ncbi:MULTISPECIES: aspartate-semialdehyde dehydrogenase [unclassified Knoellia]|uniref:aspartate-semialdehyde dehydrogenase n=1 Tax=Knoellia altitudinis TaxID=3404795 RepID=UPI0036117304
MSHAASNAAVLSDSPTLAIVGATGAVGTVVLDVLPMRRHIWGDVRLAAGVEDVGKVCRVAGEDLTVQALTPEFFDGVDVALVDIPPEISAEWAEIAVERGVVVIDNSPTFRRDPDVPLVVTEINPEAVSERPKGVIANPGATVMTMIDVLAVLHAQWELTELVVTSLQAASGLGRAGMSRLHDEIAVVAGDRELGMRPGDVRRAIDHELGPGIFGGPLALNVLPFAGSHVGDGWSSEESKIRHETRKILGLPDLRVSATCVRVPVVSTHSVSVHATFAKSIAVGKARQALVEAPAVVVLDDPEHGEFPTPADIVGADPRFVGRMRQAIDFPRTLDLFVCGDNLRKGSALNMLQTAELVVATL